MRFGINFVKYLKWKEKDGKSQKVSLDVTHTKKKKLKFKCVLTCLQKTVTQVMHIPVIA